MADQSRADIRAAGGVSIGIPLLLYLYLHTWYGSTSFPFEFLEAPVYEPYIGYGKADI